MCALYAPYKAIGYVCDSNPFVVNRLGEEIFLALSIGTSFQVFRLNKLISCMVSKAAPGDIKCMQVMNQETYVAVKNSIIVYNRSNIVRTYDAHKCDIAGLLCLGNFLISYDTENNVKIIDIKQRKEISDMKFIQNSAITAMIHPSSYVNKVLVGYANGQLELWNINKKALVYTFKSHTAYLTEKLQHRMDEEEEDRNTSISSISITCMEQTPAVDVIAIGYSNGEILLINLKLDQILFSFSQEGGAVTSLSFRTDASSERFPFMVSSSADGRLHIWNLGSGAPDIDNLDEMSGQIERKLHSSIEDAHLGAISRVSFLYGEPIMVSTGATDNSIKVWIFDAPDGTARLLRSREGHSGGPLRIRYYGGTTNVSMRDNADGMSCELVSAGSDGSVRLFNTAIESQNREMSQKPILKQLGMLRRNERLPDCIGFDFNETRQRDWGNMATIHKNHSNVYIWRYRHRVVTDMILRQPSWGTNERKVAINRNNHATAVTISPCGNFCIVGYKGGMIYKYNIQSGATRGAFPKNTITEMKQGLIDIRARIPGNVLYDEKKMAEDSMLIVPGTKQTLTSQGSLPGAYGATLSGMHTSDITGLCIDMTNTTLVSCGRDGKIVFWDFNSHAILHTITLETPQLMMQSFRDGNFVAFVGQDRIVRVYDMCTFKLSRKFNGHTQAITDLAFTPDGRRLLTSSGDSTIRVWDMPTGRCLSWMKFSTPVLTMTVSLSGEYLCVAQADREGIYMYIDKSLYESVHFWKEPTSPTLVADSTVLVDEAEPSSESAPEEDTTSATATTVEGTAAGSNEITPSQAQVVTGVPKETATQRGVGAITMSAVPKAYWTSLFHLESIKKRNKPKAPPAPAPLAPFFLPTIVRSGSTPSFPTPQEYAAMTKNLVHAAAANEAESALAIETTPATTAAALVTKRSFFEEESITDLTTAPVTAGNKKQKSTATAPVVMSSAEEQAVLNDLAGMSSAWEDEDVAMDSNTSGATWVVDRTSNVEMNNDVTDTEGEKEEEKVLVTSVETKQARSQSKLITKRTALPRCKMQAFLVQEQEHITSSHLLEYMKKLPPPAVDLELRSLCTYEGDVEGIELLRTWFMWLTREISTGDNFEILQAYLHRTLTIYSELVMKLPQLLSELRALTEQSAVVSGRFREMLHKNLCVFKMLANIPII